MTSKTGRGNQQEVDPLTALLESFKRHQKFYKLVSVILIGAVMWFAKEMYTLVKLTSKLEDVPADVSKLRDDVTQTAIQISKFERLPEDLNKLQADVTVVTESTNKIDSLGIDLAAIQKSAESTASLVESIDNKTKVYDDQFATLERALPPFETRLGRHNAHFVHR
jgi:hypothetical protein